MPIDRRRPCLLIGIANDAKIRANTKMLSIERLRSIR